MISIMTSSRIDRSARAPVPRSIAFCTTAFSAGSSNTRSTPSIRKSFSYCFTIAFFGSVRMFSSASSLSECSDGNQRQASDKLGDHAELDQILRLDQLQVLVRMGVLLPLDVRPEPHRVLVDPPGDDLVEPFERPAADEQDVARVDVDQALLGVFPPAFRRNAGDGSFQDLQQGLLHAFARHVARDRRAFALARDLVDLVDVDDPAFRLFDVVLGVLQQVHQDGLDVVARRTRLRSAWWHRRWRTGRSRIFASVCASSVLPVPVGPISRMLVFSISTSSSSKRWSRASIRL